MLIAHAGDVGDVAAGATIDFKFSSMDPTASWVPAALAGSPVVSVYKDNSVTQSTAGVTISADFDGVVGLNHVRITTVTDGSFYSAGSSFHAVITTGTVAGFSAVGYVVASFSIVARPVQSLAASVITAAAIATGAIDADAIAADAITAAKIADGAIDAATFASGAINAAAIATDAIGSAEIAATAIAKIADAVLRRQCDNAEASSDGDTLDLSSLYGLIQQAQESAISGSTLTVKKTDGSTTLGTKTVAVDGTTGNITSIS